jgi:hypothetical protein
MRDGIPRVGETREYSGWSQTGSGMALFERTHRRVLEALLIASPEGPGTCRVVSYLILMLVP